MIWDHIIIILVASLLTTELRRLDKQITYDCPLYCAAEHIHYCPTTKEAELDYQSDYIEVCVER